MPAGADIARRVVRWQARHGRQGLPWQHTRDPYRVWLSEIMLQQTQVGTVLGYYDRFLQHFPDVGALARAALDDVLALWSGLGYYSRARNLHRCAIQVCEQHGGVFPQRSDQLEQLPGVGRSTAAAIAVFCFGERAAILDGNVKRVLGRVLGFGADLAHAANQRELWRLAQALVPARGVEAYTQGLMDLGATLCSARAPRCADCPLRSVCVARAQGRPAAYPVKLRRSVRGRRSHALLWLVHGTRHWLVRRPEQGVWAGLWSLPQSDSIELLQQQLAGWPGQGELLPVIEHPLTHFDWSLQPLRWQLPPRLGRARLDRIHAGLGTGRWLDTAAALALGLPAPVRRLLEDPSGQSPTTPLPRR